MSAHCACGTPLVRCANCEDERCPRCDSGEVCQWADDPITRTELDADAIRAATWAEAVALLRDRDRLDAWVRTADAEYFAFGLANWCDLFAEFLAAHQPTPTTPEET